MKQEVRTSHDLSVLGSLSLEFMDAAILTVRQVEEAIGADALVDEMLSAITTGDDPYVSVASGDQVSCPTILVIFHTARLMMSHAV